MKKRKAIGEQSGSDKVTAYELATLASRIYDGYGGDPGAAVAAAKKLSDEARYALAREEAEAKKHEEYDAEHEKWLESPEDWVVGIKHITGERRRDRATRKFAEFIGKTDFDNYKRDGFTHVEVMLLEHEFSNSREKPKRKKSKQGRRISEHDGRLRTQLVGLIPTKPRKRA